MKNFSWIIMLAGLSVISCKDTEKPDNVSAADYSETYEDMIKVRARDSAIVDSSNMNGPNGNSSNTKGSNTKGSNGNGSNGNRENDQTAMPPQAPVENP